MQTKILITGASGFIGSHICRELIKAGHFVVAVDDLSGSGIDNVMNLMMHSSFRFYEKDCRDLTGMNELFDLYRPSIVYHLAANARESASFFQPVSVVSRNVIAYANVLMLAIKYEVKRMVLFSSIAAYGHQQPPFYESFELRPVDIYGLSKKYMEEMTQMLSVSHGLEYIIFRPHNVIGVGQSLCDPYRNVVTIWMNKIMRGEPLVIFGDGEQQRAFSYIDNSLPCYISGGLGVYRNEIFNIGSDQTWTINALAKLVIDAMDAPPDYPIEYLDTRHNEVKIAHSDHGKARQMLGLSETVSITEGIRRMAVWAREMGPQEWLVGDELEIPNGLTPKNWS